MEKVRFMTALAMCLSLGACDANTPSSAEPEADTTETQAVQSEPDAEDTVSILRSDIAPPDPPEPVVQPFEMTIQFPSGESELTQAAKASLREVLASEALSRNGVIIIGGHTDAGGSDDVNRRTSQERAQIVRDWLVDNGVAGERIDIIAFGEQNPAEPNALPDGSPNAEGRAANRRVEVLVTLPENASNDAAPSESS